MRNTCVNEKELLNNEVETKEYINIQTGEVLDLERVSTLPDNAMLKVRPDLWCEWDFEKNDELGFDIWNVTKGSNKNPYWICKECHKWKTKINHRASAKSDCPYCAGQKAWRGESDMWTTNPELAKLLANPEDGYKYMQSSAQRVDWKCPCCEEVIKSKCISEVLNHRLSCSTCSDHKSIGEKTVREVLKQISILYENDITKEWSDRKRYDFFISSLNIVIETHGEQHYIQTNRKGARSLEEEQENDKYKYEMAIQNGIEPENYIVIDCRYSDFEFIKNNILNSRLAEIFELRDVNWGDIFLNASKSIHIEALGLWNSNIDRVNISKKLNIREENVAVILKKFEKLGFCIYNSNRRKTRMGKSVHQYSSDGVLINKWESISEASRKTGFSIKGITNCCKGNRYLYKGYKWIFKNSEEEIKWA